MISPEPFGLVRLGSTCVALPLSVLREVVPAAAVFGPAPVGAPGTVGTVTVRGTIIPVVDASPALGLAPRSAGTSPLVVLLVHDERVLGILADGVAGVTTFGPDEQQHLVTGPREAPTSLSTQVLHADGEPVVVLDPRALFEGPQVPTADNRRLGGRTAGGPEGPRPPGGAGSSGDDTVILAEVGTRRVALDVARVRAVLPAFAPAPFVVDSDLCLGVTPYVDRVVPVADTLAVAGLGALDRGEAHEGLVLDFAKGMVILAISRARSVRRIARAELLPVPTLAFGQPEHFLGMLPSEDGEDPYLVLHADALWADADLAALSGMNTRLGGDSSRARHRVVPAVAPRGAAGAPADGAGRIAFLTYTAGADLASPLAQVVEVLARPDRVVHRHDDSTVGLEIVMHRGKAIPLVDLTAVLGIARTARCRPGFVLLVAVEGQALGLAVEGLHAIGPADWEEAAGRPIEGPVGQRRWATRHVGFGDPASGSLRPVVDLDAVARHVLGIGSAPRTAADGSPRPEALPLTRRRREELVVAGPAAASRHP